MAFWVFACFFLKLTVAAPCDYFPCPLGTYCANISPMVNSSDGRECHLLLSGIFTPTGSGRERMGMMRMALDHINNKTDGFWDDLLPNVTLQAIYNVSNCNDNSAALLNALYVVLPLAPERVHGMVGLTCSTETITVASFMKIFQVPQISPSATTSALSDKTAYPYFLRTAPPDQLEMVALASLLNTMEWHRIAVIQSNTDFNNLLAQKLVANFLSNPRNSIAATAVIDVGVNASTLYQRLLPIAHSGARVIFATLEINTALRLLPVLREYNILTGPEYAWLGSDWPSTAVINATDADLATVEGTLTMFPYPPGGEFFNRWRTDYQSRDKTLYPDQDGNPLTVNQFSPHTYDAAIAYAHAFHDLINAGVNVQNGTAMVKALYNTTFVGASGTLVFDSNGDRLGMYKLTNMQGRSLTQVGVWDPSVGLNISSPIVWNSNATVAPIDGACPNDCSGRGVCTFGPGLCTCYPGFGSSSCSSLVPNPFPQRTTYGVVACENFAVYSFAITSDILPVEVDVVFRTTYIPQAKFYILPPDSSFLTTNTSELPPESHASEIKNDSDTSLFYLTFPITSPSEEGIYRVVIYHIPGQICPASFSLTFQLTSLKSPARVGAVITGVITFIANVIVLIACIILLVVRKNAFPFHFQSLILLYTSVLGLAFALHVPMLHIIGRTYPCSAYYFFYILIVPFVFVPLAVAMYRHNKFHLARKWQKRVAANAAAAVAGGKEAKAPDSKAALKALAHIDQTKPAHIIKVIVMVLIPIVAIAIALAAIAPNPSYDGGLGCQVDARLLAPSAVFILSIYIAVVYWLFRVRELGEIFGLRREALFVLFYAGFGIILYMVLYWLLVATTETPGETADHLSYILWAVVMIYQMRTVVSPGFMNLRMVLSVRRGVDHQPLVDVLNSSLGYDYFLLYCALEFSDEHPLCWKAVRTFKSKTSYQSYACIFDNFVDLTAPFMVNISGVLREQLIQEHGSITPETPLDKLQSLYDGLELELVDVMSDPYERFRQHPYYTRYREGVPPADQMTHTTLSRAPSSGDEPARRGSGVASPTAGSIRSAKRSEKKSKTASEMDSADAVELGDVPRATTHDMEGVRGLEVVEYSPAGHDPPTEEPTPRLSSRIGSPDVGRPSGIGAGGDYIADLDAGPIRSHSENNAYVV